MHITKVTEEEDSRYIKEAKAVLQVTRADAVLLLVLGGKDGPGACIVCEPSIDRKKLAKLPEVLGMIASQSKEDVDRWIQKEKETKNN